MVKKHKIMKYIFGTLFFLALLVGVLYTINETLKFKYEDGVLSMEDFYKYPEDSIDVLMLGSSHLGSNIDPTQLYSEYGIASYNLWGSAQPTWNSYYYLKEALKTQHPKVVVLETYVVSQDNEETGYGTLVKSTVGMKLSEDKYNDIQASISNFDDIGLDLLFGWDTYHSRYAELSETDFTRYAWNFQMYNKKVSSWSHVAVEPNDVSNITDSADLVEKHEKYFRKIIELCQKEGIEIYLFTSPFVVSEKEEMRFNTIASIAGEYKVPYENYNLTYKNFDLNWDEDFADALGHMNDSGIKKITSYLGQNLKDTYDLPEKSGNALFMAQTDESQAYILPTAFKGDGEGTYVDTGVPLYDNPYSSYTILADIPIGNGDKNESLYFSCFNEDSDNFGGLLVRKVDDKLNIVVGSNYSTEIDVPLGDDILLAITKNKEDYSIRVNDEIVKSNWTASYSTGYKGNLMLGCELDENGDPYRFSTGAINALEVYSEVWSSSRITSWMDNVRASRNDLTASIESENGDVSYVLPGKFVGNGTTTYVDTGVKLYEDPKQNWTLLMDFNTVCDTDNKVFLSCFDESGSNYRGLLLRQDDDVLNVIVGNATYYSIPMYEDHYARLAIVKKGDAYTIYANGLLLVDNLKAPCDEAYTGDLLLGAEESNGNKYRYSGVTINRMEIYDGALEADEIVNW